MQPLRPNTCPLWGPTEDAEPSYDLDASPRPLFSGLPPMPEPKADCPIAAKRDLIRSIAVLRHSRIFATEIWPSKESWPTHLTLRVAQCWLASLSRIRAYVAQAIQKVNDTVCLWPKELIDEIKGAEPDLKRQFDCEMGILSGLYKASTVYIRHLRAVHELLQLCPAIESIPVSPLLHRYIDCLLVEDKQPIDMEEIAKDMYHIAYRIQCKDSRGIFAFELRSAHPCSLLDPYDKYRYAKGTARDFMLRFLPASHSKYGSLSEVVFLTLPSWYSRTLLEEEKDYPLDRIITTVFQVATCEIPTDPTDASRSRELSSSGVSEGEQTTVIFTEEFPPTFSFSRSCSREGMAEDSQSTE
ncbi:MAG: hypothetical protein K9M07_06175 [Simkaniaceae bacterium]|nr:hypothetical protein [Simkaniaceae bacterium]